MHLLEMAPQEGVALALVVAELAIEGLGQLAQGKMGGQMIVKRAPVFGLVRTLGAAEVPFWLRPPSLMTALERDNNKQPLLLSQER
jgi:hypothetical protein